MLMLSWYVTSHSGQLSLLPSAPWDMSTSQGAVAVLCSWEGNRRSDVNLPSQILWGLNDLRKGDEHSAYNTPVKPWFHVKIKLF